MTFEIPGPRDAREACFSINNKQDLRSQPRSVAPAIHAVASAIVPAAQRCSQCGSAWAPGAVGVDGETLSFKRANVIGASSASGRRSPCPTAAAGPRRRRRAPAGAFVLHIDGLVEIFK